MIVNRFDTKLWLLLNSLKYCFVKFKRNKNVQISKFVLGFQAELKLENRWDKYIIMIYNTFLELYMLL